MRPPGIRRGGRSFFRCVMMDSVDGALTFEVGRWRIVVGARVVYEVSAGGLDIDVAGVEVLVPGSGWARADWLVPPPDVPGGLFDELRQHAAGRRAYARELARDG